MPSEISALKEQQLYLALLYVINILRQTFEVIQSAHCISISRNLILLNRDAFQEGCVSMHHDASVFSL